MGALPINNSMKFPEENATCYTWEGAVPDPDTGWGAARQKGTHGCSWAAGSAQASSMPWQLRGQPAFCIKPSIASRSKQVILLLY